MRRDELDLFQIKCWAIENHMLFQMNATVKRRFPSTGGTNRPEKGDNSSEMNCRRGKCANSQHCLPSNLGICHIFSPICRMACLPAPAARQWYSLFARIINSMTQTQSEMRKKWNRQFFFSSFRSVRSNYNATETRAAWNIKICTSLKMTHRIPLAADYFCADYCVL